MITPSWKIYAAVVVYFAVLLAFTPLAASTKFVADLNGRLELTTGHVSPSIFTAERTKVEELLSIDTILLPSLETASFAVAEVPRENFWEKQLLELKTCLREMAEEFLRCRVIQFLMVVRSMHDMELQYNWLAIHFLREEDPLKERWLAHALKESAVGKPDFVYIQHERAGRDDLVFNTSMNLIHMAYYLARFERKTGADISEMNQIIEFGGGYGAFCRLAFRQGFQGKYVIHDLEPFTILQRHYLTMVGLPVRNNDEWDIYGTGIWLTSTTEDLERFNLSMPSASATDYKKSLLVAMFSMSEVPPDTREIFLSTGPGQFGNYLFALQPTWKQQENLSWFLNFAFIKRAELAWSSWIDRGIENRILVGSWKNAGASPYDINSILAIAV